MIPLHMGALHPVEQVATIVLAFGPFVVLGIVIAIRRRSELAEEREEEREEREERKEEEARLRAEPDLDED
ncbi:hypothetical protein [Nocardioides convexus]|uniref:hypothetical protein n=1 Tax=Nocardioides convexus TaxID=2712224 RepID=UPI0024186AD8|nr:hypothetical protein [Nocardioides convexus]